MTAEKKQGLFKSMKHTFSMQYWAWQFVLPWKFRFFPFAAIVCFEPAWQSLVMAALLKATTQSLVEGSFALMPRALTIMVISVVAGAILFAMSYMQVYICFARGEGEMLRKFFAHVQRLPVPLMEKQLTGDFSARFTTDVISATQMFGWPGVGEYNFYAMVMQTVVLSATVILESPLAGGAAVLLSLFSLGATLLVTPHTKKSEAKKRDALSVLTQIMIDILSGTAIARVFGLVGRQEKAYAREAKVVYGHSQVAARWRVLGNSVGSSFVWLASFMTLAVGALLAANGTISIASAVFICTLQLNLNFAMLGIGHRYGRLLGPAASCQRVKDVFDMPQEKERPGGAHPNLSAENAIELINLTFHYDEGKDVLHNVNLHIKRGRRVAIVGGSGGGKSTLIKLLMEFAPRGGGDIHLMGHSIDAYSQTAVRAMSAYVPQDCYLFDGSMRENIRWGNPGATDAQVEAVAREAGLWAFIESMPEGFDTRVGERGTQLSGGQRQRVAIARALLKDAPILLLDEATSSLDTESEHEVQAALDRLMQGRTSVIVAHRLSTIRHADEIIVMEEGQIVERGFHEDLIAKESRYAQLYRMQFV
ncbi:MAG: ABC transporter ATP-binding protein/permease [Clostridia bacterium]|nr:ABC transporter ATP-binding protein/permease [Clostridia bacterium]